MEQTWVDGRKYFDREEDLANREAILAERDALILKIKEEKKKDKDEKPEKKDRDVARGDNDGKHPGTYDSYDDSGYSCRGDHR